MTANSGHVVQPRTERLCAVYLRISLDATGEQLAIQRQREDCLKIATDRGWKVVDEYVDNSVSASDRSKVRPGYDRMVADFAEGKFDALVCYDLDRLSRQPRQLEDWIDRAEDKGLILVTANGEADLSTDGGRLFARIKASVSRAEVERKSARQRRAMTQKVEMGGLPAGVRLTGYDTSGAVIDSEAELVQDVFNRFLSGESLRAIAATLNDQGRATRSGRTWNPSTIRTMLMNPRYAGFSPYKGDAVTRNGERVRGSWEPIVTSSVFDSVAVKLRDPARKTNRVGTDRRYLGSGLYLCAECGRRVISHSGGRYRCPDGHVVRSQGQIDSFVLAVLRARLARPDLRGLLANPADASRAKLNSEIDELQLRLNVIENDYDEGLIDGRRYARARENVLSALERAHRQLARSSGGGAAARTLTAPDPVAAFDNASLGVQRSVISTLITVRLLRGVRGRRTFDPDSVEITWNSSDDED